MKINYKYSILNRRVVKLLITCALILCQFGLSLEENIEPVSFAGAKSISFEPKEAYKAICQYKIYEINRISQFKQIVEISNKSRNKDCPMYIDDSIYLLSSIIEYSLNSNNEICSQDHVMKIENFHNKYMSHTSPLVFSLPVSLRKFFVGYTLLINKFCKENLSHFLLKDSQKLIKQDDYNSLEEYIGKDTNNPFVGLINIIMDKILDMNLDVATENKAQNENEIVYMESPNGEQIKKIQSLCERRFRPIYEKLIIPSVSLTSLGYKYKVVLDSETNSLLRKWNRIVYVCESLRDIFIVDNPENKGKIITYTKTEAEDMKAKYGHKEPENDGRDLIIYKLNDQDHLRTTQIGDDIVVDNNQERVVNYFITQANKYNQMVNRSQQNKIVKENNKKNVKNFFRYLFNRNPYNKLPNEDLDLNCDKSNEFSTELGIQQPREAIKPSISNEIQEPYEEFF